MNLIRVISMGFAAAILALPLTALVCNEIHDVGHRISDFDFWFLYWTLGFGAYCAMFALTPWERRP